VVDANSNWTFCGISGTSDTQQGNGLTYLQPVNSSGPVNPGTGYVFVFNLTTIDYFNVQTGTWVYGWKPLDGSSHNTGYLSANQHAAMLGEQSTVYYCDGCFVSSFVQKGVGTPFDPATVGTYTFTANALGIEFNDTATALTTLGVNILVGGMLNAIYVWDGTSFGYSYRILLPENNVASLVTVNTTTYAFVGNRGRIYSTNGFQSTLFAKIPDHLSGTVEPYFTWGGTTPHKNQIYFGFTSTTNAAVALTTYGGLWAIDLDTKAMRLTNQLSYGTYAGGATAIIANFSSNPSGTGLFIGWTSNSTNTAPGIDKTVSTPYTTYIPYVDTDLIPIGTYLKPFTPSQVEFKLSTPMVSGEGVQIWYRTNITESFSQIGETLYSATKNTNMSDVYSTNFQNVQWIQLRVFTKSTASTPSYVRLKEIRLRNQQLQ